MIFFVILFLLAGIALVIGGRQQETEALRATKWPVTEGKLEQCEVVVSPGIGSDSYSSWRLQLRYSYVVRGVTYHSTRYAIGYSESADHTQHRDIAEELNRNPTLSVHYDPAHPAQAVLSVAPQGNVALLGYWCLGLAALSAVIAMVSG